MGVVRGISRRWDRDWVSNLGRAATTTRQRRRRNPAREPETTTQEEEDHAAITREYYYYYYYYSYGYGRSGTTTTLTGPGLNHRGKTESIGGKSDADARYDYPYGVSDHRIAANEQQQL